MEEIASVLLFGVLGGGGLLVALIFAITTGSARSERLRRLELEQESLRRALKEAAARVAWLEGGLGEAMRRIDIVHAKELSVEARVDRHTVALAAPEREVDVAVESEPAVAPGAAAPDPAAVAAVAPVVPIPTAPVPEAAPVPVVEALPAPVVAVPLPAEAGAPAPTSTPAPSPEAPAASPPVVAVPEASAPAAEPPYAIAARVAHEEHEEHAPPPPRPPPSVQPPPPPARFDWERWVGVRGAAALGASVLVIAGLYFFKYSIENDLISPAMRVVLGVLVGVAGVAGSELKLRRDYVPLANWLEGAGVAILYTAFWFAHQLGLVPATVAFGLMALVTATCGLLAARNDAIVIAVLGLLGGFCTPAALSTGEDHPFGLFGYLLLLDAGLLYLARRKQWQSLAVLSLVGTALYQAAWIGLRMGPDRLFVGMGILVVFSGGYLLAAPAVSRTEGDRWGLTRASAVLLPFAFGLYFGLRADLGEQLWPLGLMLAIVCVGAGFSARHAGAAWLHVVTAIAATTVVGVWLATHEPAAIAWEAAVVAVALAAVFHAFAELDVLRPREGARGFAGAGAAVSSLGLLFGLVAVAALPASVDPWPWLAGWLALGLLTVRQSLLPGLGRIRLGLAVLVDVGFVVVHAAHADQLVFPVERFHLVALLAVTALGLLSAALIASAASSPKPAVAPEAPPRPGVSPGFSITDALAALLPFLTLLDFAGRGEVGPHLLPAALALIALTAGAAFAARAEPDAGWMVPGASVLGLATLAVWLGEHAPAPVAVEASLLVCAFAAVLPAFVELHRRRDEALSPWIGRWAARTPVAAAALLAATATSPACVSPWPWLVGWTVLAAFTLRQLGLSGRDPWLYPALAAVLGVAFPATLQAHATLVDFPGAAVWMAAGLVTAVGFLGASFLQRDDAPASGPAWSSHGAGLAALLLLVGLLAGSAAPLSPALFFFGSLAFAAVALIVAARLGAGGWSFATVLTGAFAQTVWVGTRLQAADRPLALGGLAVSVVLLTAAPLVSGHRLQASRWAWRAAAVAGPLWFPVLAATWNHVVGRGTLGLLPVLLGGVTFAVAWRARLLLPAEGGVRLSALVWLCGVTLCAVSLAIPLQLRNEWVTVGWALEGVALLALWRRLDHAGLEYTGLAHLAVVAVRLTCNPWLLEYHPRSGFPVFNWLAYTYWVPVAALLGGFYLLRDLEVARRRPWEATLLGKGAGAVVARLCAAAAIIVFFVWINLTIFDAFGTGSALEVPFERLPARDLTLSLAWALYALLLLGVGMARRSAGLRWTSMALIIVTILKVFLYDLSHLHDLYRVMSLVGLAFSLILISLAYQRFVFPKSKTEIG
jgi:uncharacterized membrane protein